jgi:Flp pilus assembly protein TadG
VIAGWLAKIVILIALLGFAAFELGSPLWTRAQLDSIAHDAADEGARVVSNGGTQAEACAAAEEESAKEHARITKCTTLGTGATQRVTVTVFKEAKSYLLKKFGPTSDWYDVTVSAASVPDNK